MRIRRLGWLAVALGIATTLHCLPPAPPKLLDAVATVYHEDAPSARPVAALNVRLLAQGGTRWLELDLRARGAGVVPLPGLEGVHGVNLRTAQDLHRILRDDRLRMVVRVRDGHAAGGGRVVAVRHERLPTRRILASGDIDLHARTQADWPVVVTVASDALSAVAIPSGHLVFELFVDRVSRLRVTAEGDRIAAIESLGEPALPFARAACAEASNAWERGQ